MPSEYQSMFEETMQLTRAWIEDLAGRMHVDDPHKAYLALRTVLHELRDHLPPELAAHMAAQLPMLVRGFYFEGWKPVTTPVPERKREAFLDAVAGQVRDPSLQPEAVAAAVFALLNDRLSDGQVEKVRRTLPPGIRSLWPGGEGAGHA
ncbi:hypothetical protein C882_1026 [Caenispirillum salinarum AK4]|uniref:DUF2267 domain-containing protein n=1 Tax=Caenispirillum salinarum AK4 TaxID=1238182 RepID=K9GTD3_9PROT|nr:DUF2267 domain-containing protein [Caenispirillum salinarum]EKV28452.1 hypothetical protein C882_1026 [Caenispirillum salinarum AK4]